MEVHRAPIQTSVIIQGEPDDKRPMTRTGYLVYEAYTCYEAALGEVGPVASGKALHFAADLVCSGGLDIWIRGAYSYAVLHIGLANPRIFVYLRQRITELDKRYAELPQETFYNNPDVQSILGETVLVLQLCPKRSRVTWPKVDMSTKREGWLKGVANAPETKATKQTWSSDADTVYLYLVSNELCKAVEEGGSERALFWVRWVLEEDARIRKETKGHGLTTKERGPATHSNKGRTEAGHYIAELLFAIYKDLSSKNLVRMHEEFSELIRLWRGGEGRMPARLRRDCLGMMTLICCEVPRWKVPAAQSLVPDPIRLSRAVSQVPSFFKEVLAYPPLKAGKELKPKMMKANQAPRKKKQDSKQVAELSLEEHLTAYDAAMEAYLSRSGGR